MPHDTLGIPDASPLTVGRRVVPSRYFLAPLAGYTQLAFRMALRELGGLGLATTDLVHAPLLLAGRRQSRELVATSPVDQPLSVQIFGGRADELAEAARWLEAQGYGGVDLNMGCPMAKVNGSGGGARLLCDTDGACRLVARVVEAVSLPVTVKMRLGWDGDSITAPALAREFEKLGAAAVTVHGRTRQQGFGGCVDQEGIRATVEAVERMPVIGNGDVRTVADAFHMRRTTGCAAVAIGRGAMLDPWIFRRLDEAAKRGESLSGKGDRCLSSCDHAALERRQAGASPLFRTDSEAAEPTPDEQLRFLVRHFSLMWDQHAERSCTLFRKFAAWYGARLGIPEDLEDRLRRFESREEFDAIVEQIRHRHGERRSTRPTALVRVPNGPVERW